MLANISSLEEIKKSEKEAHDQLKQQHCAIVKQLEEEKVAVFIPFLCVCVCVCRCLSKSARSLKLIMQTFYTCSLGL